MLVCIFLLSERFFKNFVSFQFVREERLSYRAHVICVTSKRCDLHGDSGGRTRETMIVKQFDLLQHSHPRHVLAKRGS